MGPRPCELEGCSKRGLLLLALFHMGAVRIAHARRDATEDLLKRLHVEMPAWTAPELETSLKMRIACVGDSITFGDGQQPLPMAQFPELENAVSGMRHPSRGSYPMVGFALIGARVSDAVWLDARSTAVLA
jgi:hypothetical protein